VLEVNACPKINLNQTLNAPDMASRVLLKSNICIREKYKKIASLSGLGEQG
jgi:hypothetical protein